MAPRPLSFQGLDRLLQRHNPGFLLRSDYERRAAMLQKRATSVQNGGSLRIATLVPASKVIRNALSDFAQRACDDNDAIAPGLMCFTEVFRLPPSPASGTFLQA